MGETHPPQVWRAPTSAVWWGRSIKNVWEPTPPITVQARTWYNPNVESRWGIMPSLIATLSMMQTLLLSALSVAREREQGTFDQLLVTPYTRRRL